MTRTLLALLLLAAAAPSKAIMPGKGALEDGKRFGLDHFKPTLRKNPDSATIKAFRAYNTGSGGKWRVQYSPRTGLPNTLYGGGDRARPGMTPDAAAREYLAAHSDVLGVDPSILTIEKQTKGNGHQHILYRQSYKGLPVEFAAVKMHLDMHGAVIGVASTFEPNINLPTTPQVSPAAAAAAAKADAGARSSVHPAPSLVVVPLESDGLNHLAWKLRVDGAGNSWRYYVDAITGQVLFRYGLMEFFGGPPCVSSGVISGLVYDIDPATSPGQVPVTRPFLDEYVYVGSPPTQALTGTDPYYGAGFFCASAPGQTAMSLQGPWASVSQFRGPSAHYDNGNGAWSVLSTPVSSPHPYPVNADIVNTIDLTGLTCGNAPAVEFLPVFQDFFVGNFDGGEGEGSGDILDDDKLIISDGNNNNIADYVGNRGGFNGAAVHGSVMHLTLQSNDTPGLESGYDIAGSSCLALSSANGPAPMANHVWTASDTWISANVGGSIHGEISLFYHINLMHDYFLSDVDMSSAAPIVKPVIVMSHVGPNLLNAFYDPDYDDLSFGDVYGSSPVDWFMDDATVPHHEYTHYVVQKIWNIQNYGQAGTLSEANADYWSATSLNDPAIGRYVNGELGNTGPLRQLDDTAPGALVFNPTNPDTGWQGEIHLDSPFLSQALWDIRRSNIGRLGQAMGVSCTNGLIFQALLYFPESFAELYEDMIQVDNLGAVPNCGGASTSYGYIYNAFIDHGIAPVHGDAYEPDDGFETAVDISTLGTISATIFPTADEDFYSFGAGPGLVQINMTLPYAGLGVYQDYQLKLYNVSRQLVAGAAPPSNGGAGTTIDGTCAGQTCTTTAPSVSLSYNNPTGGLLYVQVVGGDSVLGSNSGVNSIVPYTLSVSFPHGGALSGGVVSARYDHDLISFAVNTSTFVSTQDWNFSAAQLRDQSQNLLPGTLTHIPAQAGDWLTFVSSQDGYGQISGSVQLVPGFASRFPAAGTVYLEVLGYDVSHTTSSMGLSNPLNLSDNNATGLTAYNNLFNPLLGQQATVQYAVNGSGRLTVKVYTVTGRLVFTVFDGDVNPGKGSLTWNGQNGSGSTVASGIYVVRAVGPGLNETQKIAVIK